MFYFIRKIIFKGRIGVEYVKNPTKVLELNFSKEQQKQLQQYLTFSQRIKHKMLTEFDEKSIVPAKFLTKQDNFHYSFACFGFSNIYDYLEKFHHTEITQQFIQSLKSVSTILDWDVSELRIYDRQIINLDFDETEKLWLKSYSISPVVPEDSLFMKF